MRKFIHNDMVESKLFTALNLTSQVKTRHLIPEFPTVKIQQKQLEELFSRFYAQQIIVVIQKAL